MTYAIETSHLSKNYGHVCAVKDVNLRVKPGEVYGFLGLNGAGKTTTIRALLGMIRPSTGTVKVLGQALGAGGRGPWAQVGHLVETPSAYPELTVRENLDLARRLHGRFLGGTGRAREQITGAMSTPRPTLCANSRHHACRWDPLRRLDDAGTS